MKVRENATKNQLELAEQVYGKEQVAKKHRCTYYKPRYLRKFKMATSQTFAYTQGIEGWSEKFKVHLVGHSLGAQTIRYLQYLLRIGYFDDEYKDVDRSNWIASISGISPPLNGAQVTHNFGYDPRINKFKKNTLFVKIIKYKVIMANLMSQGGTQNVCNEIFLDSEGPVRELSLIKTDVMYDINAEHFGWNRRTDESVMQYISRIWNDDYLETVQNNAF